MFLKGKMMKKFLQMLATPKYKTMMMLVATRWYVYIVNYGVLSFMHKILTVFLYLTVMDGSDKKKFY